MSLHQSNLVTVHPGVVTTLTLNRPERHNSLVPELLEDFCEAVDDTRRQAGIRAVVLQANGASFSTGGDVYAFHEQGRRQVGAYAHELVGLLNRAMLGLLSLPVPVVCACHGLVTGGSLGFLLASDLVLVNEDVRIQPFYSVVGFSPDGGWSCLLPGRIGRVRALDVLTTNRAISARECLDWGIASRLVEGDVREAAAELAGGIADKVAGSIAATRKLVHDPSAVAAGLEAERQAFVEQIQTDEAWEGMARFLG